MFELMTATPWQNKRSLAFLFLLLIVPLGIGTKFYRGPGWQWFNEYAGDILYEIAWCLFFFLWFPKKRAILPIAVGVFLGTCALEFLQLWKHPLLEALRSTLLGKLLLGTTFVPADFFYYALGSALGWWGLQSIWNATHQPPS